ncbi:hypothetical protein [Clostridium sp.]|uniref:hypothetical protein n=1 Tax=Clostridium sp. TaxID=1506 RepID=UPI001A4D0ED4|nr:hypothetical protein [Clostridium sp.]MBK5236692.1 hypothetical protein [Clostridium sp.]
MRIIFTKYKEVVTRNDHKCFSCGCTIIKNSLVKYGVTTDTEVTNDSRKIVSAYWCNTCVDSTKHAR